jgi:DNA-directed RNA polymerase specialized sigma24 family protein
MYELSYKEIAAIMDITPKTVENQIGLALKFLKKGMEPGESGSSGH